LYVKGAPDSRNTVPKTVLAYRDDFRLGDRFTAGGELASDGSRLLRAAYQGDRASLYGYHRHLADKPGDGVGAYFSCRVGRAGTLFGGMSRSGGQGSDESRWRSLAVRYALRPEWDVTAEVARSETSFASNTYESLMLGFPVGPVRAFARLQFGDSAGFQAGPQGAFAGQSYRDLATNLLYFADPKLNFQYQSSFRWGPSGQMDTYQQLLSTCRLSRATQLQLVTGFPNLMDPDHVRLRVEQQMREDLALLVDYGALAPYQDIGVEPGERGFRVMVRKTWTAKVPARGGEVSGRVADPNNQPVRGAVVALGSYRTLTDVTGAYRFQNIPVGEYALKLDQDALPADVRFDAVVRHGPSGAGTTKSDETSDGSEGVLLRITSRTRERVDFRVVPLNSVTGAVYEDRNKNGHLDAGEGLAGVVLHLDGHVTATDAQGAFGFYNLDPGPYTIRLDAERLPQGYRAVSPGAVEVQLLPDQPFKGAIFEIGKPVKGIIFQPLP
jgi:hypothetical protein